MSSHIDLGQTRPKISEVEGARERQSVPTRDRTGDTKQVLRDPGSTAGLVTSLSLCLLAHHTGI